MTPSEQKFEAAIYRKLNQERLERAAFERFCQAREHNATVQTKRGYRQATER